MDSRVQALIGVILQTNGARTLASQMLGLKLHKVCLKRAMTISFNSMKRKEQLSPAQGVEVAFQPSTRRVNKSREKEKKALAARVCMIYVLLSSVKSLASTSSYHVHSHRCGPHYLLLVSVKMKCLLYQNMHLK